MSSGTALVLLPEVPLQGSSPRTAGAHLTRVFLGSFLRRSWQRLVREGLTQTPVVAAAALCLLPLHPKDCVVWAVLVSVPWGRDHGAETGGWVLAGAAPGLVAASRPCKGKQPSLSKPAPSFVGEHSRKDFWSSIPLKHQNGGRGSTLLNFAYFSLSYQR